LACRQEDSPVNEPEDDFAALFEASIKASRVQKGQAVEGTIVAIGPEVAFVNIGGKGEAMIALAELKNDDGVLEVAVGDRIQATVVSTEGGLTLSRHLARSAATDRHIEDAYRAHLPVEGKVEKVVKGGFEVRIGRARAFCPLSQIDIARNTDPAAHVGRVYAFRITEHKDGGKNLVVSRRALQDEEQRAAAAEIRKSIVPGAVMTGTVASVRDFGAFIDLGAGVQGLLHISEMGWSRVSDTSQIATPGEVITVKVLRVDEDGQKIALGLKQLTDDPWSAVASTYAVGQVRQGRVTRLADFGAFVELEPGVEGLAHASTFAPARRSDDWRRSVTVGMTAAFEVVSVEIEKKRIGVAMVPEGSSRAGRGASPPGESVADDVREYAERQGAASAEAFGSSLAEKLRGALKPR
jgi:small subunit ribosomal protein S1